MENLLTKAIPALDPKKDAAALEDAVEHMEDHGTEDLKALADHFVAALSQFCDEHTITINISKKETTKT